MTVPNQIIKISQLPSALVLNPEDLLQVVQDGDNKKFPVSLLGILGGGISGYSGQQGISGYSGSSTSVISTGSITLRNITDRFADIINVKDFGAIGDGSSHPISSGTAAAYNTSFGSIGLNAVAGDENDWVSLQIAFYQSSIDGRQVYIPRGIYYTNKPLSLKWTASPISGQPQTPLVGRIHGDGSSTQIIGKGISASRGIIELLGTSNIHAVNSELSHLDIIADISCNIGSYCLRIGDAKQSFAAHKLRLFGPNCLSLKTDTIASYANICTKFSSCTFISNYNTLWASETSATVYAINHETTGSGGTQTWVDSAEFDSCLIGGLCRVNGLAIHFNSCLQYCPATRPSPFNRCIDFVHGGMTITSGYFEDYAEAVHIEPDDITRYINFASITGTIFNGSPVYGSACKYAIKTKGNILMSGNGVGSIVINSCGFDANHTTSCIGVELADATIIEPNDDSFFSGDVTTESISGGRIIKIDRGQIKLSGGKGDKSAFEHFGTYPGPLFSNFGNLSSDQNASYFINLVNDASSVASIVHYSSNFVDSNFSGGLYIGAGTGGKTIIGQNGTGVAFFSNGRCSFGSTADDGQSVAQIYGTLSLSAITPGSTPDGTIWYNATRKTLSSYINQTQSHFVSTPDGFTNIADITVANTLTELSIAGAKGISGGFLKAGKSIKLTVSGYMSSTGTPNLNIRCKWGSVELCSTGNVAQVGTPTNTGWECNIIITCRSVGTTGTVYAQGWFNYANQRVPMVSIAVSTIDTTVFGILDITATWGALNLGNSITSTNYAPEILQ